MHTPDQLEEARSLRWATQLSAFTTNPDDVDGQLLTQLAEMGFEGVHCLFGLVEESAGVHPTDPRQADLTAITRAGSRLRAAGIEPLSTWGYWAALVATDSDRRADAIAQVVAAADVAAALGCPYVVTGSGSNAVQSAWHPHPDNYGPAAIDRLIASLEVAVPQIADRGAQLVLKPHVLSTIRNTDILSHILTAIDSPNLRAGFDPVNLVQLDDVYGARELMDANIAAAQGRLAHAHVKDYVLQTDTVTHIAEVPVGEGMLDLGYFLACAAKYADQGWVIVEHLKAPALPDAMRHLRASAPTEPVRD